MTAKTPKPALLVVVFGLVAVTAACGRAPDGSPAMDARVDTSGVTDVKPMTDYEAGIRKFQEEREAALTTETGWLTIAGLFFLSQPSTTFGSDPLNDIVLPAGAPARAGTFELRGRTVSVTAEPGVTFQLGDRAVTSAVLRSDAEGTPDRIGIGDLQLWVHMSGDRLSIRLRDKNNPLRTAFAGTSWFPIDDAYRVEAVYEPYDPPRTIQIPNILGDVDTVTVPGIVSFSLHGQALKMEVVDEGDDEMWFIFRDLTSGKETYPAARFLYTPLPVDGKVTLDFNRAENPPCAYNPFTTCPLPPQQNRLPVRIEAGEKAYGG